MSKNYISELRDKIALAVLPELLSKCDYLEFSQITDLAYNIADIMLYSRKKESLFNNNIKENK